MAEKDRWQRIEEIVQHALELSTDDRDRYLTQACEGDSALRLQVDQLLAVSESHVELFEDMRVALPTPREICLSEGDQIEAFRIVRLLRRGGMGAVYLADDVRNDRRVALKISQPGAQQLSEGEHRILARFNHPDIATLYASGKTKEGLTYFAMEYVDGQSVTEYCDKRRLGLRERLTLFERVCRVVGHAHAARVVHCDLKPDNVMVTPEGVPKLLDFGIAKVLEGSAAVDDVAVTGERRAFTLAYASPEQLAREPTLPASDVYSLGVLLCVILTGRLPYAFAQAHDLPWAIRNEAPSEPSKLVCTEPSISHPLVAPLPLRERQRQLSRQLRGDIDAIVLKALCKEPQNRYLFASDLAEDIRRYLAHEPVLARGGSFLYRAGRLCRRYRVGFAVAALFLVGLLAAVLGLLHERRAAIAERDRAEAQTKRAERVQRFVVDLLLPADPYDRSGAPAASVDDLLSQSAETVEASLDEDPDFKASLLSVLGKVTAARGNPTAGRVLLQKALAIQRRGAEDAALAETLQRYGEVLTGLGDYRGSDVSLAEARGILRGSEGPQTTLLRARVLLAQAANNVYQAEYQEARQQSEEALRYLRDSPGDVVELSTALHGLGRVLDVKDRDDEAEALLQQAIAFARRLPKVRNVHVATIMSSLATLRAKRGDYADAERILTQALEIKRATLGEDSVGYAVTLHNLAAFESAQGKHREALGRFSRVVEVLQDGLPANHLRLLTARDQLASTMVRLHDYKRAENVFLDVLATERRALPENHPMIATTLNNLGFLYQDQGRLREAEASYVGALEIFVRLLGRSNRAVATLLGNLAFIAHSAGDTRTAEARFREALEIARGIDQGKTPEAIVAMLNLASFDVSTSNLGEARRLTVEVAQLCEATVGPGAWLTGSAHSLYAKLLLAEGDVSGALAMATRAKTIMEAAVPPGDARLAAIDSVLGAALARSGKPEEAEPLLVRSVRDLRRLKGDYSVTTMEAMERTRLFLKSLGRHDEAARYARPHPPSRQPRR